MGFINLIQTIIRKSNGDILNFYVKDKVLFCREFVFNKGWKPPSELISGVEHNQLDIKIDNDDRIYGIVHTKSGEVIYLYTKNHVLSKEKLFEYDTKEYIIKYPYIQKFGSSIHILYYLQDVNHKKFWGIINHYNDGKNWTQNNIVIIKAYPVLNPFVVSAADENIAIFYLDKTNNNEEIFSMTFDSLSKIWRKPQKITETNNKKLYLNVLSTSTNFYNITWSEFIDDNLTVRYVNYPYEAEIFDTSQIKSLSPPSNCSLPTLLKTGDTLWNTWVEMDKLFSCYSLDNGKTWSNPNVDTTSTKTDFIRFKFCSNRKDDLNNFNVNSVFGTYYPKISFIGFKNYQ